VGRLTSQEMPLQVLGVQICFIAVWTRKFSICVLGWYHGFGRGSRTRCRRCSTTRCTRQNSPSSLRPYDMCGFLLLARQILRLSHTIWTSKVGKGRVEVVLRCRTKVWKTIGSSRGHAGRGGNVGRVITLGSRRVDRGRSSIRRWGRHRARSHRV